jgi:hypothetical protein
MGNFALPLVHHHYTSNVKRNQPIFLGQMPSLSRVICPLFGVYVLEDSDI